MATIALRDHSFLSGSEHIFTEKSFRGKGDSHLILTHSTLCTTGLVNLSSNDINEMASDLTVSAIPMERRSSILHFEEVWERELGESLQQALHSRCSLLYTPNRKRTSPSCPASISPNIFPVGKKASGRQRGLEKSPGLKRSSPGVSGLIKAFCSADPQRLRWSEYKSSFLMPRSHAHFTDLFDSDGLKLD